VLKGQGLMLKTT